MKEIKKLELELLANVCKENNISIKLADTLIKQAEKMAYQNLSQGARLNEYQGLIDFYVKSNKQGDNR